MVKIMIKISKCQIREEIKRSVNISVHSMPTSSVLQYLILCVIGTFLFCTKISRGSITSPSSETLPNKNYLYLSIIKRRTNELKKMHVLSKPRQELFPCLVLSDQQWIDVGFYYTAMEKLSSHSSLTLCVGVSYSAYGQLSGGSV